jgi:hypothetical protein
VCVPSNVYTLSIPLCSNSLFSSCTLCSIFCFLGCHIYTFSYVMTSLNSSNPWRWHNQFIHYRPFHLLYLTVYCSEAFSPAFLLRTFKQNTALHVANSPPVRTAGTFFVLLSSNAAISPVPTDTVLSNCSRSHRTSLHRITNWEGRGRKWPSHGFDTVPEFFGGTKYNHEGRRVVRVRVEIQRRHLRHADQKVQFSIVLPLIPMWPI